MRIIEPFEPTELCEAELCEPFEICQVQIIGHGQNKDRSIGSESFQRDRQVDSKNAHSVC